MIYYLEDLKQSKCDNPECTSCDNEIFFAAKCHPHTGMIAYFNKGKVTFRCKKCKQLIIKIAIPNNFQMPLFQNCLCLPGQGIKNECMACFNHTKQLIQIFCFHCQKSITEIETVSGVDYLLENL